MRGRKRNISESIKDYDFKKLSRTARHPREKLRYLTFSHIQDGKSNIEIAKMLRVNRIFN